MRSNANSLRERARISLAPNYFMGVLAVFLVSIISAAVGSVTGGMGALVSSISAIFNALFHHGNFEHVLYAVSARMAPLVMFSNVVAFAITAPLSVGSAGFFLSVADRRNAELGELFKPFKNWINCVLLNLLTTLYTFLWSLLFIIPGIAAALNYSMAPFIMAEHPELSPSRAMQISKEMMQGNRCRLMRLYLSFIGWYFLCLFTAGIGTFFLSPYVQTAVAHFFNEISGKDADRFASYGGA